MEGLGVQKFGVQLGGHWLGGWISRGRVQGTQAGRDKGEAQAGRNRHPLTGFELRRPPGRLLQGEAWGGRLGKPGG